MQRFPLRILCAGYSVELKKKVNNPLRLRLPYKILIGFKIKKKQLYTRILLNFEYVMNYLYNIAGARAGMSTMRVIM